VVLRQGQSATAAELIEFVRARIAHFKAPKDIRFEELPKTSTGKIQKHVLRERAMGSAQTSSSGKVAG
jgi:fatty-acyl-CoA synthase